jgi:multidrug efflux pump
VRGVLAAPTPTRPKGISPTAQDVGSGRQRPDLKAIDYEPLVIAYHNGVGVRVSDVGEAVDSVEDLRNAGYMPTASRPCW